MRRALAAACLVLGILALLPSRSTAAHHAPHHDDPVLRAIDDAAVAGEIDARTSAMLRIQRIFEPESLPERFRVDDVPLLRCATPVLLEALQADLTDEDRARVAAWTSPAVDGLARRIGYTTPGGHFALDYVTTGTSAVPLDDVDPANGIPDYVERVGQYFEESWQREFDDLGFAAPDLSGGPYQVFLRRISAYGYTSLTDVGTAGTSITVHHTFLGFPDNDDPEGPQWGAAKVTAAHELKHASQFANNGWTESGLWVEIDATWMEDVVYDQVNDFYNYITFRSPITDPPRALDDGGSGSYAEAIWQHWMSESWGVESILTFWNRRAAMPQEPVLQSYAATIELFDGPLVDAWPDFATWNYASGANAIPGYGYEEAARFPTPPLTDEATNLPASFSGSIDRLAANFLRVTGFDAATPGVVTVTPQIPPTSPVRARAVVTRRNGAITVEDVVLENGVASELTVPADTVADVVLVLGHGDLGQGSAVYQVDVAQESRLPIPLPNFDSDAVRSRVAVGETSRRTVALSNDGAAGSVLAYDAVVVPSVPAGAPARSIGGSDLTTEDVAYTPATTTTLDIVVTNRSVDFEWLKSVAIDFPAGVTVVRADDFLAPGSRRLVADGSTGDGAVVTWSDPDGAWGNVQNGESATAQVEVRFASTLHGDLVVPYTLEGDGFGAGASSVEGALLLTGPSSPMITVDAPELVLRAGRNARITWTAAVDGDVAIDLSRDGGATWETIADPTPNDGSFDWDVTGPTTFDAVLRVRDAAAPADFAKTNTVFAIAETSPWAEVVSAVVPLPAGTSDPVEVEFDATSLAAGTYTATLAVVYDGMASPALLPVELVVSENGTSTRVPAARGVVHGARPNPFNPTTHVEFTLHRASHVRVDVFDTAGRHVRSLVDGDLAAGDHAARWDGVDADGRPVASGVYLYVVDLQGERSVGKVGLVK